MIAGVKHLLRSQEGAMGMEEEMTGLVNKGLQRHPGQPVAEWVNVFEKAVLDTEAERLNVELKSGPNLGKTFKRDGHTTLVFPRRRHIGYEDVPWRRSDITNLGHPDIGKLRASFKNILHFYV